MKDITDRIYLTIPRGLLSVDFITKCVEEIVGTCDDDDYIEEVVRKQEWAALERTMEVMDEFFLFEKNNNIEEVKRVDVRIRMIKEMFDTIYEEHEYGFLKGNDKAKEILGNFMIERMEEAERLLVDLELDVNDSIKFWVRIQNFYFDLRKMEYFSDCDYGEHWNITMIGKVVLCQNILDVLVEE